jgi:hypothetical protein
LNTAALHVTCGAALNSCRSGKTAQLDADNADASFTAEVPDGVAGNGRYLEDKDLAAAQHILSAAAYTYVAAALMSLLNIARWIRR